MEKKIQITYWQFKGTTELSGMEQELVAEAWASSEKAYAPYSRFSVGSALRLRSGQVVTANNQENIAYPSGLCAERVALFFAGANFPDQKVDAIAIVAEGDLVDPSVLISPCGGCRQVMIETEKRQGSPLKIILVNAEQDVLVFESSQDLLPLAFGKHP